MLSDAKKKQVIKRLQHAMEWDFLEEYVDFDDLLPLMLQIAREKWVVSPKLPPAVAWDLEDLDEIDVLFEYLEAVHEQYSGVSRHNNPGWSWYTESFFTALSELGLEPSHLDELPETYRAQGLLTLYTLSKIEFDELDDAAKDAFARVRQASDYDKEAWVDLDSKLEHQEPAATPDDTLDADSADDSVEVATSDEDAKRGAPETRIDELVLEYEALDDAELEAAIADVKDGAGYRDFLPFVEKHGCAALIPIRAWYYADIEHYPAASAYYQLLTSDFDEDHCWLLIERVARLEDLPGYQKNSLENWLVYGVRNLTGDALRPPLRHWLKQEPHHEALLLLGLVSHARSEDVDYFVEAMQSSRKTIRELGLEGAAKNPADAREAVGELLRASKADIRLIAARFFEEAGRAEDAALLEAALDAERSKKVKAALNLALEALGHDAFDDLDEAEVLRRLEEAARPRPHFVQGLELELQTRSEERLSDDYLDGWIAYASGETAEATDPFNFAAREFFKPSTLASLGAQIFDAWSAADEPADQKWAVFQLAVTADIDTLDRAAIDLEDRASSNYQQAGWFVAMLGRHGSKHAAAWLDYYRKGSVHRSLQKAARVAWEELLASQEVDEAELAARLDPHVRGRAEERRAVASGDGKALLKALESAMVDKRRWTHQEFVSLMKSELIEDAAHGVVFRAGESLFQVLENACVDHQRESFDLPDADVEIVHPLELDDEQLARWGESLASFQVNQSFEQLSRAVFTPEDGADFRLERVRLAGLSRLGYSNVNSSEWSYEAFRSFKTHGVKVRIKHGGFMVTNPRNEGDELVEARLAFETLEGSHLEPEEVPPIVFSEARRALARVAR